MNIILGSTFRRPVSLGQYRLSAIDNKVDLAGMPGKLFSHRPHRHLDVRAILAPFAVTDYYLRDLWELSEA